MASNAKFIGAAIIVLALLVLANTIQFGQAQLANSPWPKFMHDPQNTGRSSYVGPQDNTVKWTYSIGKGLTSSPAIASDGTVYFAPFRDNKFYALNPNGELKWSFQSEWDYWTYGTPAISTNGTIYFTAMSKENKLYALNDDGDQATVKWYFSTSEPIYTSPTLGSDGTIFIGTALRENKLYAIRDDGNTATVRWAFQSNYYIIFTPAISADGKIYLSTFGDLYALRDDGDNVEVEWVFHLDNDRVNTPPSIGADGMIYFGTTDGRLYSLFENGAIKWSHKVGKMVVTAPAIAENGTVYVGIWDNDLNDWIIAIRDNVVIWSFKPIDGPLSSPIVDVDGTVFFCAKGSIYALNPDGTLKWSYIPEGANALFTYTSSPVIASDGALYVGWETSEDSHWIYAFGPISEQPPPKSDYALLSIAGAVISIIILIILYRRMR